MKHTVVNRSVAERIYSVVKNSKGMTCDEVEGILGLTHQRVSPRFHELIQAGVLASKFFDGRPVVRATRSKSQAGVYFVVAKFEDYVAYMREERQVRLVRSKVTDALHEAAEEFGSLVFNSAKSGEDVNCAMNKLREAALNYYTDGS